MKKTLINVLKKYIDYINVFLLEAIAELLKYTGINSHLIDLNKGK